MPKLQKVIENLKHPNSRKTISLTKKIIKNNRKNNNKLGTHIKQNLIGERILWFKERIPQGSIILNKEQALELIEAYLTRFNEELKQIELKNSVGQRRSRQHASREDIIKITKEREKEEFDTCGIEIPDLLDQQQMNVLKNWNGELRFLQHFKLRRFARKHLI